MRSGVDGVKTAYAGIGWACRRWCRGDVRGMVWSSQSRRPVTGCGRGGNCRLVGCHHGVGGYAYRVLTQSRCAELGLSYGIYLWHEPFAHFMADHYSVDCAAAHLRRCPRCRDLVLAVHRDATAFGGSHAQPRLPWSEVEDATDKNGAPKHKAWPTCARPPDGQVGGSTSSLAGGHPVALAQVTVPQWRRGMRLTVGAETPSSRADPVLLSPVPVPSLPTVRTACPTATGVRCGDDRWREGRSSSPATPSASNQANPRCAHCREMPRRTAEWVTAPGGGPDPRAAGGHGQSDER